MLVITPYTDDIHQLAKIPSNMEIVVSILSSLKVNFSTLSFSIYGLDLASCKQGNVLGINCSPKVLRRLRRLTRQVTS